LARRSLDDHENPAVIDAVRAKVLDVCARFPVYGVGE
jgi:glycine hydroxymethyltransferase